MDPQTCLKATLKNKYQSLNADPLLPSRLCYRSFKCDEPLADLCQHEFRYVDKSQFHSWLVFESVPLEDILSCDCKHDRGRRTIITLGACGVGKTTTVQRCALDWAEGKGYHDISFLFPLAFWELSLLQDKLSLVDLLQTFYPELKELDVSSLNEMNVWFFLDGLDQSSLFPCFSCPAVNDVYKKAPLNDLVTNLIRGNLLPNAHIWITTRYAAAPLIPDCYLLKETEMQGFSDEQKEQHFRSVIGNDHLANKAIDHVKISRSLNFLCQIPQICTIVANVLKNHLKADDGFKISRLTLTQIYTLLVKTSNPDVLDKLKKLALLWLGENAILHERHLGSGGLSVEELSAFSKECPLVLREETGLHNTTVFHFSQTSVQEFLAASAQLDSVELNPVKLVDDVLQSAAGQREVFLRFVFGLVKERALLQHGETLLCYTKKKMLETKSLDMAVGLFRCLREYDSQALLDEMKFFLKLGISPILEFNSVHWQFLITTSRVFEGIRERFEMELSTRCDERLLRHLPDVLKSKHAMLRFSNLTDKCCPALAAVLSTSESHLRELDLGYNSISNDGVRELVEGLIDGSCRLRMLRLQGCGVTADACKYLAKALKQAPKLKELDLSMNEIGDNGVQHLAKGLKSPECHLETLKLSQCNIELKGCHHLALAVQKNSIYLKALDLSINMLGDKGANELFSKIDIWQLTKLEMYHCGLTALSCGKIGEALKYESSTLVELNLSNNNLRDAGFALICEGMYAWCSLEKLNVSRCGITTLGCCYLAKVLCCISQLYNGLMQKTDWQAVELKEIDISMNCLGDPGVKDFVAGFRNPYSHLKSLDLSHCSLTDECCADIALGFALTESIIRTVDLSGNDLRDKGVKKLCVGLRSPECNLKTLSLRSCGLTSKSIEYLVTALKANPSSLAELHLMGNKLSDSGIGALVELTENQKYTLHTIDVSAD